MRHYRRRNGELTAPWLLITFDRMMSSEERSEVFVDHGLGCDIVFPAMQHDQEMALEVIDILK